MALRVTVDHDRCVGSGMCEAMAEDSFTVEDDGLSHPADPPGDGKDALLDARDSCPTEAIAVYEDGEPLD